MSCCRIPVFPSLWSHFPSPSRLGVEVAFLPLDFSFDPVPGLSVAPETLLGFACSFSPPPSPRGRRVCWWRPPSLREGELWGWSPRQPTAAAPAGPGDVAEPPPTGGGDTGPKSCRLLVH